MARHCWLLAVAWCLLSLPLPAQKDFAPPPDNLKDCQAKVVEWQGWYNSNTVRYNEDYEKLMSDFATERLRNKDLQEELASSRESLVFGGIGLGSGLILAFLAWRGLRWLVRRPRLGSVSPAKKQLAAMVLAALWISISGFAAQQEPRLAIHPINMAFTVIVYSLPALLFGGIAFWWFGKAKQA